MTQFGKTLSKVLDGTKTATSRLVKPGDVEMVGGEPTPETEYFTRGNVLYVRGPAEIVNAMPITRVDRNGRILYEVGKDYAIQPGRGQKSVGRYRITAIERYDVRTITPERANAEGFKTPAAFLEVWVSMHDKQGAGIRGGRIDSQWVFDYLKTRPAAKYDAWYIAFEVLEVYA
jgi:hypothetical protein